MAGTGYSFQEYEHLRTQGSLIRAGPTLETRVGATNLVWDIFPRSPFTDGETGLLRARFVPARPERFHLMVTLRGECMWRLDTNDGHRESGVLRRGTHFHEYPNGPPGLTTFDLDPPLDFPALAVDNEPVPYLRALQWFCLKCSIDYSQADLTDLEEVQR